MQKILFASRNKGKLLEIQSLLSNFPISVLDPASIGIQLSVTENGNDYTENALLKARAYSQESGLLVIADDSGLEVDALDGAPGIYSARFSPKINATDADRRRHLLTLLSGHPPPWTARFRCSIAIVTTTMDEFVCSGSCIGEIIPTERGDLGFGYDPIFYFPPQGKTMAELSLEEKNLISHRALAINAVRPILSDLLKQS